MHIAKLNRGVITTDTCTSAKLLSAMLAEYVKDSVREKIVSDGGIPDDDTINVLTQDYHHHLQNVWIGAVNKHMS